MNDRIIPFPAARIVRSPADAPDASEPPRYPGLRELIAQTIVDTIAAERARAATEGHPPSGST